MRPADFCDLEKRPVTDRELAACLGRALALEHLGDAPQDGLAQDWYMTWGTRAFPVADAMARYDMPRLVAEIKRLRAIHSPDAEWGIRAFPVADARLVAEVRRLRQSAREISGWCGWAREELVRLGGSSSRPQADIDAWDDERMKKHG